jgi:GST-like protein
MVIVGSLQVDKVNNLEAYLWATPNSRRISILFEELGFDYKVHPISIRAKEQFQPHVLRLNPYGKLPIVTWQQGGDQHVMSESGAILLRFGAVSPELLPQGGRARDDVMTWLMFALTSLGPMTGNAHHWAELAPVKPQVAIDHHVGLVTRAYRFLEDRLANSDYLAGTYSLADIAAFPWVQVHDWANIDINYFPAIAEWLARVGNRPSVARGMATPQNVVLA